MDSSKDRLNSIKESAKRRAKESESELEFILTEAIEDLKKIDPIKRKKWIEDQLVELYHMQDKKCAICGKALLWGQFHVDHKIPHSKGGGNEFSNLQLTHPFCNQSKNDGVALSELLRYLEGRVMNL